MVTCFVFRIYIRNLLDDHNLLNTPAPPLVFLIYHEYTNIVVIKLPCFVSYCADLLPTYNNTLK